MTNTLLLPVSFFAAYMGGMAALFAPCCITFLLPAYFGSVFKERARVLFMTGIFTLGLASIMVPVAFGVRVIVQFLNRFHETVYVGGGVLLIGIGLAAVLGKNWKIAIPHVAIKGTSIGAVFILGALSGITSACCAPVLAGVLALSATAPTLALAALVGFTYVLGMVTPLFALSLAAEKTKVFDAALWQREVRLGATRTTVADLVAGIIFIAAGIILISASTMRGTESTGILGWLFTPLRNLFMR